MSLATIALKYDARRLAAGVETCGLLGWLSRYADSAITMHYQLGGSSGGIRNDD